jgi:hypothetical protein
MESSTMHISQEQIAAATLLQLAGRPVIKVPNSDTLKIIKFLSNKKKTENTRKTVGSMMFGDLHSLTRKEEYEATLKRIFRIVGLQVSESQLRIIANYYFDGISQVVKHRNFGDFKRNLNRKFYIAIMFYMRKIANAICLELARQ